MIKKSIGLRVVILPLALAIVALFSVLYIQPKYIEMQANRKILADDQIQLATIRTQSQKLTQIKASWQAMEERKLVSSALPADKSIDDYIAELYQKVAASGALMTDVASTATTAAKNKPYLCSSSVGAGSVPGSESVPASGSSGSSINSEGTAGAQRQTASYCGNSTNVSFTAKGNWDQTLNLLKYLAGTNRIANLTEISITPAISQDPNAPTNPDLLISKISLDVFFMPEQKTADPKMTEFLASSNGFSQDSLKKIKAIIFSQFQEPSVSESGERNLFK